MNTLALPLDGERLEELVGLIVRGLMFHHWGVALGPDMVVETLSLTKYGEAFFDRYSKMNAKQRVADNIGDGALVYEGVQGVDNDAVSFWQLSLYGGFTMASADGKQLSSKFGVLTGPKAIADRANERVASGKYIIQGPSFLEGCACTPTRPAPMSRDSLSQAAACGARLGLDSRGPQARPSSV